LLPTVQAAALPNASPAPWGRKKKWWSIPAHRLKYVETEKSWRVKRQHWCHETGLDSLFQKPPIITHKKQTV
jgi:hypothetical protein